MKISINTKQVLFLFSLTGILLALSWFYYLSPRPQNIRIINPDLSTSENAQSATDSFNNEGLFWISFSTEGRSFPLNRLRIRTLNCLNSLTTNFFEFTLPPESNQRCNNHKGFLLKDTATSLAKDNTWYMAGSTQGGNYGVVFEKDWSEPPLVAGMAFLFISLSMALFLKLPLQENYEKMAATLILCGAFFLRFWLVFVVSPQEMTIYSDMAGYFYRGLEINNGIFNPNQLFQPIGFTLWSLGLRKLGGFEILSWSQIFFSWGIVLLIYLMTRERFGKLAGLVSLMVAGVHIPQAAMAAMHLAENTYAFLITLTLWLLFKTLKKEKITNFLVIGFLLSLAFYFKGNHSFFIPALAVWLLYRGRSNLPLAFKKVCLLGLGCLLVVIPHLVWTNKNYQKPYLGPTAGALNFVEGKCPSKDNQDSEGSRWMSPLFVTTGEHQYKRWSRPFTDQAYFWKEGLKCIQENPKVLLTSFRYINYLFFGNQLWPIAYTALGSWYTSWTPLFYYGLLPFSLLGFLLILKRRDAFDESLGLMMLTLFFTVWFFKSENRFRVPFDAIIIFWSSYGFAWVLETIANLIFVAKERNSRKNAAILNR